MFRRGELKRTVLAILRTADGHLSNPEKAKRVIEMKGWDAADVGLARSVAEKIKDVRKRIGSAPVHKHDIDFPAGCPALGAEHVRFRVYSR